MPHFLTVVLLSLTQGAELDDIVATFDKDAGGFCGCVLVASKGTVLLEKGYGLADAAGRKPLEKDALWDWASVSKQFTAAAVLKLQDQKKLKLDDPILKFSRNAPSDKARVTLRQLLDHTSGIKAGFGEGPEWRFDAKDRGSFEQMILNLPMISKPGEKWEYSNSSFALAAAIVEHASGMPFEEYCIEQLFKPAGMKNASFIGAKGLDLRRVPKIDRGKGFSDRPPEFAFAYGNEMTWGYRGAGGVVATTRDLLQWDRALRTGKLLSKAALSEFYTPALENYALGWFVLKSPGGLRVEHGGGVQGVSTYFVRELDEDIVVVIAASYEVKTSLQVLAESLVGAARRAKGRR